MESKNLEDVYVFKQISWNIWILADKDDSKFRTDHYFSLEKKVAQFFAFVFIYFQTNTSSETQGLLVRTIRFCS